MSDRKSASEGLAQVRNAKSWESLVALEHRYGTKGRWVFRGQREQNWELESTLERAVRRFNVGRHTPIELEGGLIRQFARRAHHHMPDPPKQGDWVEWMALMQHHGAPTRLLDFTYSFYVGLFFALEDAERGGECALWAVDVNWVDKQLRRIVGDQAFENFSCKDRNVQEIENFKKLLGNENKMAFFLNPYRLNQRLSIQQGLFLCPGNVSFSMIENLRALGDARWGIQKIKIKLNDREYQRCIRQLIRMNMTRATLFPGLDGFAMSQKTALANPHVLVGDWEYPKSGQLQRKGRISDR